MKSCPKRRLTIRRSTKTISLVACLPPYVEGSTPTLCVYNILSLGSLVSVNHCYFLRELAFSLEEQTEKS
jgi:hypothetical protein